MMVYLKNPATRLDFLDFAVYTYQKPEAGSLEMFFFIILEQNFVLEKVQ